MSKSVSAWPQAPVLPGPASLTDFQKRLPSSSLADGVHGPERAGSDHERSVGGPKSLWGFPGSWAWAARGRSTSAVSSPATSFRTPPAAAAVTAPSLAAAAGGSGGEVTTNLRAITTSSLTTNPNRQPIGCAPTPAPQGLADRTQSAHNRKD